MEPDERIRSHNIERNKRKKSWRRRLLGHRHFCLVLETLEGSVYVVSYASRRRTNKNGSYYSRPKGYKLYKYVPINLKITLIFINFPLLDISKFTYLRSCFLFRLSAPQISIGPYNYILHRTQGI